MSRAAYAQSPEIKEKAIRRLKHTSRSKILKTYQVDIVIFNSSKDINVRDAIVYASRTGADYIIYGYVTNWVDRPTKYTHPQDFAGLRILVKRSQFRFRKDSGDRWYTLCHL